MAIATKVLFDMMASKTTKAMLFGDACPIVTRPIAQISKWWNMWQLSYADTDPLLSDRKTYTNFYRTVPSDSDFNFARLAILKQFNWTRVGTIFQDPAEGSPRYSYAHSNMLTLFEKAKIGIVKVESFRDDPDTAIRMLKENDVRIIIGNFNHTAARRVFCSAYHHKLYGSKYVWIILGGYPDNWWKQNNGNTSCSVTDLNITLQGYIATDILPLSLTNMVTESGLTSLQYKDQYNDKRRKEYSKYHGYAFDGVWVIAKTIDKLLRSRYPRKIEESYFRGIHVASALNDTDFLGVTGRVQFHNGDRLGMIELQQFQGDSVVKVGEYLHGIDFLDLSKGVPITWPDGDVPRDRKLTQWVMQKVSTPIYVCLGMLCGIGIVMAMVFLIINVKFRKHRYIKMSSPNMNNLIIVGCIMTYVSVYLLGTDGGMVNPDDFRYICTFRSWILAVGFTFAFGAMFSKTWRVHAIFTNIKLNRKVIKDYKLFMIVCLLLLLDAIILGCWQITDPLHRATKNLTTEMTDDDIEVIPVLEYCASNHMEIWLGVIYAYKGILLIFGCFLAWETRHVSIPALNDSKYIGMSVYNVVMMCVCGAAVSFIIKDQPNPAFIIIGLFIIFSTTITLCLVFVPKVIELKRDPSGEEKRIRATIHKRSKKEENNSSEMVEKLQKLDSDNKQYKQQIDQKTKEIRELLVQLQEDPNSFDITKQSISPMHKKVAALRSAELSPSKFSRASSDGDSASVASDTSATTQMWAADSPPIHRLYLQTRPAIDVDITEITDDIEMTDISKGNTRKTLTRIPSEDGTDDAFGGVYLGPETAEYQIVKPLPVNNTLIPKTPEQSPNSADSQIVPHSLSGISFLDYLTPTGNSIKQDQDMQGLSEYNDMSFSFMSGLSILMRTSQDSDGARDMFDRCDECNYRECQCMLLSKEKIGNSHKRRRKSSDRSSQGGGNENNNSSVSSDETQENVRDLSENSWNKSETVQDCEFTCVEVHATKPSNDQKKKSRIVKIYPVSERGSDVTEPLLTEVRDLKTSSGSRKPNPKKSVIMLSSVTEEGDSLTEPCSETDSVGSEIFIGCRDHKGGGNDKTKSENDKKKTINLISTNPDRLRTDSTDQSPTIVCDIIEYI